MIISNTHGFIFFHVPKTGGTTLSRALGHVITPIDIPLGVGTTLRRGDLVALDELESRKIEEAWIAQWKIAKHATMSRVKASMGDDLWARFRKIAFVRNPFDRAASGFRYTCKTLDASGELAARGFLAFLQSPEVTERHLGTMRPQCHVLDLPDELDFLGYLETFEEDLAGLEDYLGLAPHALSPSGLVVENVTSESDAVAELGDAERELIRRLYDDDFRIFGYSRTDRTIERRFTPRGAAATVSAGASTVAGGALPELPRVQPPAPLISAQPRRMTLNPATGSRRCILHIGCAKTGTTSIQTHFGANREAWRAQGVLFPETGSDAEMFVHTGISRAIEDGTDTVDIEILASLAAEIDAARDCSTVVISSEIFHSRCRRPDRIQVLHDVLRPLFDQFEVVFYVRRQDRLAVSAHTTAIKGGWTDARDPLVTVSAKGPYYFDFARVADTWTGVFGREALRCRVFEAAARREGGIVADFLAVARLPSIANGGSEFLNATPPWQVIEIMRAFNGSSVNKNHDLRRRLWRWLIKQPGDHVPLLTRTQAQDFLAAFAASNERLAREYLGHTTATPFDGDFSMYPEELPTLESGEAIERMLAALAGPQEPAPGNAASSAAAS